MKRYLKTITAVVLAALTTAACQKENFGDATPAGQEVDVTLDLLAPQIGTKSYGDGKTVNKVFVHVYQQDADRNLKYIAPAAAGESATPSQVVDMTGGAAKYSTRLVTGQTYTFVFWAQADNAPYTYDAEAKTITVDYTSAKGNDESRDAFYNVLPNVKIEGAYTASVQLSRPFAQLNFGAADYEEAKAAGLTVTDATVTLTHAATSLNLLDGTTAGDKTVTFASAALPADPNDILKAGGKDYKYVAMDYVLVGKSAKTLSDVTLTLTATGTHSATPRFTYSNVPLQANYRTNIVGNLFTSPAEVQIEITPGFGTPDNDVVVENVSSIAAANEAFANGATAVNVTNILSSEDTNIVLPQTTNRVSLTLPAVPTGKTVTIKYADGASEGQKPQALTVNAKSADAITIEAPNTHVELNGVTVGTVTASTSSTTLVVGEDVKIGTLKIEQGAADIYGNVSNVVKGKNAGAIFCYVKDKKDAPANVDAVCVKTAEGLTAYVNNQIAFEPALNRADKVVLEADMELNAGVVVSHDTELNLNKHIVSNVVDIWENSNAVVNVDNCTLSISGNGSVKAKAEDCYTFNVKNGGKLVINGGDFVGNVSVIQVEEGVAEVYGGNFSLAQTWPGAGPCGCDFMINMIDANYKAGKAKAVVKGGTFVGFNPGDCEAEGAHTNFLADSYYTEKDENNNFIVKNLAKEFAQGGVITLASDCRTGCLGLPQGKSLTLDLNGKRVDFISGTKTGGGVVLDGSLTIKGDGFFGDDTKEIIGYLFNVNESTLVVEGNAEITCGLSCIQLQKAGSKAYVKGGKWIGGSWHDKYWTINKIDAYKDSASVIISGGEFFKFDPSDAQIESPVQNWVASGYKSVQDGDWYKVVAE